MVCWTTIKTSHAASDLHFGLITFEIVVDLSHKLYENRQAEEKLCTQQRPNSIKTKAADNKYKNINNNHWQLTLVPGWKEETLIIPNAESAYTAGQSF